MRDSFFLYMTTGCEYERACIWVSKALNTLLKVQKVGLKNKNFLKEFTAKNSLFI